MCRADSAQLRPFDRSGRTGRLHVRSALCRTADRRAGRCYLLDLGGQTFDARELTGTEAIFKPFRFDIRFAEKGGAVLDPDALIRTEASLRLERGGAVSGLPTGFTDVDRVLDGLKAGDLIIVAGRPSMGKSAFALNVAENVALAGKPVMVFSLEMGDEQLAAFFSKHFN